MKRILTLFMLPTSLAHGESAEATDQAKRIVSLFVVLPEATEGGSEVVTPSKSSKGIVAGRPGIELPSLLDFEKKPRALGARGLERGGA
jgi:hypothetical protein